MPLKVTDDSGEPPGLDVPVPAQLVVRLCYREFQRELTPAVASDPGFEGNEGNEGNEGAEAGLWIESYRIDVRAGAVDPTGLPYTDGVLDLIRAGDLAGALAVLAQGVCLEPPEDTSIVLATLTVGDNGGLAVDTLGAGAAVPTNLMLMRMIACLAARIEECCAHPTPRRSPRPSPPPDAARCSPATGGASPTTTRSAVHFNDSATRSGRIPKRRRHRSSPGRGIAAASRSGVNQRRPRL